MKLPEQSDQPVGEQPTDAKQRIRSRKLLVACLVFFTAFGVRLLNWQSNRGEVAGVQTSVALNYKHLAGLIHQNGLASLYDPSSTTSNPDLLGHPPGYPILLSLVYKVAGDSDTSVQFVQMILDSLSAVIILLIAAELFPVAVSLIAGLMAAFAPQFSWNSILLLPDSLAALPILLALLLITRVAVAQAFLPLHSEKNDKFQKGGDAGKKGRHESLSYMLAAGALIGVSCWLRANVLVLAPFLALSFLLIFRRGERLRPALMLVFGACLIISPLTIRNALVFGKFIPVSLGAGQTLIEGIADYNTDGTLGLPQTDMELIRGEAETYQRRDYANSLFTPDGPARDRARLARGFAVIRTHPVWFVGVMIQRAASMLKLERTPLRLPLNASSKPVLLQWPLRAVQKLFITAIFLPLVLLGAGLLIYERRFQLLAFLLAVPCYYFCVQSALHTEYRYVLVIHYFLFVLAAVALRVIGSR
ncbi:MAG TPA: glycosyltransferase family 39 protein, partial [Pyrinomonadaceae bacterium]